MMAGRVRTEGDADADFVRPPHRTIARTPKGIASAASRRSRTSDPRTTSSNSRIVCASLLPATLAQW